MDHIPSLTASNLHLACDLPLRFSLKGGLRQYLNETGKRERERERERKNLESSERILVPPKVSLSLQDRDHAFLTDIGKRVFFWS